MNNSYHGPTTLRLLPPALLAIKMELLYLVPPTLKELLYSEDEVPGTSLNEKNPEARLEGSRAKYLARM